MIRNRIKIFAFVVLFGFIIIDLFLYIPNSWQNFSSGLFFTMGASVPFLIIVYIFFYIPRRDFAQQIVPSIKELIEQSNNITQDCNNNLVKYFGTCNELEIINKPEVVVNSNLMSLLRSISSEIWEQKMRMIRHESDLSKFKRFSLGTFIFDIFNKKFFDV